MATDFVAAWHQVKADYKQITKDKKPKPSKISIVPGTGINDSLVKLSKAFEAWDEYLDELEPTLDVGEVNPAVALSEKELKKAQTTIKKLSTDLTKSWDKARNGLDDYQDDLQKKIAEYTKDLDFKLEKEEETKIKKKRIATEDMSKGIKVILKDINSKLGDFEKEAKRLAARCRT